jgi:hypothetical protein
MLLVQAEELKSCHFSLPHLTSNVNSNRTYTEWQRLSKTISSSEETHTRLAFTLTVFFIRLDILQKYASTGKECYKDIEIGFPVAFNAQLPL